MGKKSVSLEFLPSYRLDLLEAIAPNIDVKDSNDDRILASILKFAEENQGEKGLLLSHDFGILLKAKSAGIAFLEIPQNWLLAPEKDQRDKEIDRLKAEVEKLKSTIPIIKVNTQSDKTVDLVMLEGWNEGHILSLLGEIKTYHPMQEKAVRPKVWSGFKYIPPKESEISTYKLDYNTWFEVECRDWLEDLYDYVSLRHQVYLFGFKISNEGNVPLENLVLEISAKGDLEIAEPSLLESGMPVMPKVPVRPEGKVVHQLEFFAQNLVPAQPISAISTDFMDPALFSGRKRRGSNRFVVAPHAGAWIETCN